MGLLNEKQTSQILEDNGAGHGSAPNETSIASVEEDPLFVGPLPGPFSSAAVGQYSSLWSCIPKTKDLEQ